MANTESLRIESAASADPSPVTARGGWRAGELRSAGQGASRPLGHGPTPGLQLARDLVALTKPRITANVLLTGAVGVWVAPGEITRAKLWLVLVGTALIVGSANTLNMWWERDIDGKMRRTKQRPLPAGRMSPDVALAFGLALALVSVPMLFAVNVATGVLGLLALVTYVTVYTPLKRYTAYALFVGAVPGAIPPLLGWTSVTGRMDLGGLLLFALMFLWQIPHFAAITLFRGHDYAKAGLQVLSVQRGEAATRRTMTVYTALLVIASVLVFVAGVAGRVYLGVAALAGAAFFAASVRGWRHASPAWARRIFGYSLVYLVLIMGALVADRIGT